MSDRVVFETHRKLSTESKTTNTHQTLSNKRAALLLSLGHIATRNGDWLASEAIEDQLSVYAGLVDDRKGINNFASATRELASKLSKDCKGWKSSLPLSGPNVRELLEHLKGECSNPSENGCTASLPTKTELEDFGRFLSAYSRTSSNSSLQGSQNASGTSKDCKTSPCVDEKRPDLLSQQAHFPPIQPESMRQSCFVPKKPINFPMAQPLEKDITAPHYASAPHRKFPSSYESKAAWTSNTFGSGGIYSSRVGGRFKKWGSKNKDEDSIEDESFAKPERPHIGNPPVFRGHNSRSQEDDFKTDQPYQSATSVGLSSFKTATDQLREENQKKYGNQGSSGGRERTVGRSFGNDSYQPVRTIKKSLGGKGSINSRFVSPFRNDSPNYNANHNAREAEPQSTSLSECEEVDERLKNVEPRMIELIKNEIMDCGSKITWDDIAGLHFAKTTIQEIVVWPMLRPDIFTGLRRPPKGILLFGPPGTGKTLIGKCIASQSGSTFFSISASSLTSKWIGEGEKMVRALFAVARVHQPAVVFIDEIDSLLSQRSESEHESSRRIKTEFLVQLDGAGTDEEDRLLVIGATNRPQELDEAARRRLVKRLYIPLPDQQARKEMIVQLMKFERNELSDHEIEDLAKFTDGYSGADMKHLCQEACLGPIRSLGPSQISSISANQVRPVNMVDFTSALKRVHPSVGPEDLHQYVVWNKTYGSGS